MKKLFFTTFCSVLFLVTYSQQVKWDSTYRPGNYAVRVGQFRSYPDSEKDIVFLGNSITDYTDWNELLQIDNAKNRGISGDITFGILERLDEVTEGKPTKIFILIGINDISRNIPDSVILSNYKKMISRIKKESPTTKIYFNTIMPVNNTFTPRNHFNKDEHIQYINNELKKIGKSEKITVIDVHPYFLDADGRLDKKYTYDGLHPNYLGYEKWAQILKPYINE